MNTRLLNTSTLCESGCSTILDNVGPGTIYLCIVICQFAAMNSANCNSDLFTFLI